MAKRVLLLMSPASYRSGAFLSAAQALDLEVVRGIDLPAELAEMWNVPLALSFRDVAGSSGAIVDFARRTPLDAILAVDDSASLLAAEANAALGLPSNSPEAAVAARDKLRMRELLSAAGVASPVFRRFTAADDPERVAGQVDYPCVVQPTRLNPIRGVIPTDTAGELAAAFRRTA